MKTVSPRHAFSLCPFPYTTATVGYLLYCRSLKYSHPLFQVLHVAFPGWKGPLADISAPIFTGQQ